MKHEKTNFRRFNGPLWISFHNPHASAVQYEPIIDSIRCYYENECFHLWCDLKYKCEQEHGSIQYYRLI
jgi:hypothetical protein